jgi:hypothetical protein
MLCVAGSRLRYGERRELRVSEEASFLAGRKLLAGRRGEARYERKGEEVK